MTLSCGGLGAVETEQTLEPFKAICPFHSAIFRTLSRNVDAISVMAVTDNQ